MARSAKNAAGKSDLGARLVQALNHPIRIRILERLSREDSSAARLAEELDEEVSTVAYHLCRVLFKECKLVKVVAQHQRRGAVERVFSLRQQPYFEIVRVSTAAIAALEGANGQPNGRSRYAWRTVAVDARGEREISLAMDELAERIAAVEARCASDGGELTRLNVGAAAFVDAQLPASLQT